MGEKGVLLRMEPFNPGNVQDMVYERDGFACRMSFGGPFNIFIPWKCITVIESPGLVVAWKCAPAPEKKPAPTLRAVK